MNEKTALVLSGGGSRGAYEIGVVKALNELGIKIDGVYGTSVGSINSAMVVMGDINYTSSLWEELKTENVFDVKEGSKPITYIKEAIVNKGAGTDNLKKLLSKYIDEEYIRKSSMDFGITCVELESKKLHYLRLSDIPNGKLIDYILASSAYYPAIHSINIDGIEYIDGGYGDTMPVKMALDDGYKNVIVVNLNVFGKWNKKDHESVNNLVTIKSKQDLGFQLTFEKDRIKRLIRIGYLDTLKEYGKLSGNYMTFENDIFNKQELKLVDKMLFDFNFDPTNIYNRESVYEALKKDIEGVKQELIELSDKIGKLKLDVIKTLNEVLKSKKGKLIVTLYIGALIKKDKLPKVNPFKTYEKYANYLIKKEII